MKLKTSLQVSAVFPVALAIIVTLSIFIRSQSLKESRAALAVSQAALPMIFDVNSSLYTYLGNPSPEARAQCVSSIGELRSYCEVNAEIGGVLGFLISEVGESAARLSSLAGSAGADASAVSEEAGAEMSRLFARGFKVLSYSRQNAETKEQASETAFLVFIAVFAMLMTGGLFSASTRIMRRLTAMKEVCDKIRGGDMRQRIDVKTEDEIGDFGRSFNALIKMHERELTKLRSEVGQHRKGEETRDTATAAARAGNMQLADALTKLKRAQGEIVQRERVRALEQVITGVARDFNDMLAPVLTMSDYLLDDPKKLGGNKELEADIRVINGSARKTLRQVRVLTDLFQAFEEPSPHRLRLSDMVEEAEKLVKLGSRHDLGAYKIEKNFDDVPFVAGNEVDYMEAIRNLIENAVESMKEGSALRMTLKAKGNKVLFSVRDDGQGMSDEVYKRALEPFFSTKGKGHSGMGLTFVVVAIGKFGGSVDIKSSEGHGTTVTLTLPAYDPKIHKKKADPDVSAKLDKLKILVVDDEEWTRVVLTRFLSGEGHQVESAAGGIEGCKKFEDGEFDVVILDRAMPDMTGDEVAGRITELNRGASVIMLTGFGDIMIEKGEAVAGVDLVMSKPVTIAELRAGISKVLAARKA